MNISSWLKGLLSGLPDVAQYMVVIFLVLIILYLCLLLTRLLGRRNGEKVHYDNPEEYEKQVPDLFASTAFRRKAKKNDGEDENDKKESKETEK